MTDTREMSDRACNALAAFVAECRPDWQQPGVVAALRAERESYDPWQLAVAMIRRASDPANTTPRLQAFDGEGFVSCRRHPGAAVRTDGTCGVCWAEANGSDEPYQRPVDPDAERHPLEAALARLTLEEAR